MQVELDHVIWGCSDLDAGRAEIEARFGQAPVIGGRHPGMGTRNALLGLQERVYFEILAPDPSQKHLSQKLSEGFGRFVRSLPKPRMVSWAGRCDDLNALAERISSSGFGLQPGPILEMSRSRPDGSELSWRLMTVDGHDLGGLVPFFIEWGLEHPCDRLPVAGKLRRLCLRTSQPGKLRLALEILKLENAVDVVESSSDGIEAELELSSEMSTTL